jgi:hypothetical protein
MMLFNPYRTGIVTMILIVTVRVILEFGFGLRDSLAGAASGAIAVTVVIELARWRNKQQTER